VKAEVVCAMEDTLQMYQRPDEAGMLVDFDEGTKPFTHVSVTVQRTCV